MALQGIFWFFAISFTVILVIQFILSLMGFDHSHHDFHHGDDHLDTNFKILSLRSIIAFLAMFGWTGLTMLGMNVGNALAIFIALCIGSATGLLVSLMVYGILKLKQEPTINYNNFIGLIGRVYIKIQGKRESIGKVNVVMNGKIHELKAVTDEFDDIFSGESVMVEGIENNILIVKHSN